MWLNKSLLALICLFLVAKIQFTNCIWWAPIDLPGEKRIDGVRFLGEGTVHHLSDKDSNTAYAPPPSPYPYFWVDLKGLYNITTIQMLSQNNWYNGMNGINTEFQISTWDKFIHPCKKQIFTGWKACQTNAKFTKKGQVINFKCAPEAAVAQYVMFSRGSPTNNETILGPYAAEIWFYGERINDGGITPEPEDNPEVENVHLKVREVLLTGLNNLWVEQAWVEFKMNPEYDDVALGWHHARINAMAIQRSNGRIIAVLGTQWLTKLEQDASYGQFKINLIAWLTNGAMEQGARFVHADEKFQDGDILVAMRNQTFDVQLVKKAVLSGTNPLIVGYVGNKNRPNDSATELLRELEVNVVHNDAYYGPRDIPISGVLGSKQYIPLICTIKMHLESWKMMRTLQVSIDYTAITNNHVDEIKYPRFQKLLKELLDKYYPYFRDRYPCAANLHKRNDRTKIAWYNYNVYTMAQKSEEIVILPGVEIFPGLVQDTETPTNHRVTINAHKSGYFYPTGVYVNAGQLFKWKVISTSHNINDYYFTISCHKDNLYGLGEWKRWPRYMHLHQLSAEDTYASPVGGVLFVRVTGDNHNITVELENVYRHPWFDLRNKTSVDDWDNERKRYNGVPWMAYMGDAIHICLPIQEVVKLNKEDLVWSTNYLDNVVKIIHNFRGSQFENDGFQVFATDIQLSAGWGHAGIPIMGHLAWAEEVNDIPKIRRQSAIGMTHEIGHNLQSGPCTFKHGGEVSNNVYHFPVRGNLLNISAYVFDVDPTFKMSHMNEIIRIWNGSTYEGVNVGYYNWLGMKFGEGLLINLFHASWQNRNKLRTEEEKTNFWLSNICEETGYNVLPWQELWHFPITQATRDKCEKYPCFFPDDQLTQRAPEIVKRQIEKQPNGCVREVSEKVQSKHDILRGLNEVRPQFTFFH